MKRLKTILLFLVICISCFGQKSANKFDDWIISNTFYSNYLNSLGFISKKDSSLLGFHFIHVIKPVSFNIAIDKKSGFYFVFVNLFFTDEYSIDDKTLPHLYLKTDKEKIVKLKADKAKSELSGKFIKLIFFIPNIRGFVSKHYVKCRIWIGRRENVHLNDLIASFGGREDLFRSQLIYNKLKVAEEEVTSKYEEYKATLEHKTEQQRPQSLKKINDPLYDF